MKLVTSKRSLVVAGNHDYAIAGKLSINYFSPFAREGVLWSRRQLSDGEKQFLINLDMMQKLGDLITIVHGTLHYPEMFEYIQTGYQARMCLDTQETSVCFFGHTHVPLAFFYGQTISFSMDEEIPVDRASKTLVNVGSVGQPRDENPLASCAVYDDEAGMVWIHRAEYDIESAIAKINKAGLPDILGERLRYGR
jgi:diadenosine tetraphosphatase ApaH/serine/threonine PP2A family protein phosphatase